MPCGDRVFSWRTAEGGGLQLLVSGTDGPPTLLRQLDASYALASSGPSCLAGKVYSFLSRGAAGEKPIEIWSSDGTAGGTVRALSLPLPDVFSVMFPTAVASAIYFIGISDIEEIVVWRTDGTAAGTFSLPVGPSLYGQDLHLQFTALGGSVFFQASDQIWRTDGTAAPAVLVDSGDFSAISSLTVFGGALYYVAKDGRELWRSDGTVAGTVRVATFGSEPDFLPVRTGRLVATADRLFAVANDGVHGQELWVSDGTAAGTRIAADVAPGALSSSPNGMTAAGDRLYFAADDGLHGVEPWSYPLSATAACQPTATALCLAGGRFRVEVDWRDFDGNTGQGQTHPLSGDTGAFWFFSASNLELVVKVLDGRALDQAYWVFYGALSSVEYAVTVTDTQTGLTRRYTNPRGELASVADTGAFGPQGASAAARSQPAGAARKAASPALVSARTEPSAVGACVASATRLCLSRGRFAVEIAWKDFNGNTGKGQAIPLTADTGTFWFFDPANFEVIVKVLDGRPINGKFWLFYGALSTVEYTLTVTDGETGAIKMYKNALGDLASLADTAAF